MNVVFWVLMLITAILIWAAISGTFWKMGLVAREVKKRVEENLNEDAELEEKEKK